MQWPWHIKTIKKFHTLCPHQKTILTQHVHPLKKLFWLSFHRKHLSAWKHVSWLDHTSRCNIFCTGRTWPQQCNNVWGICVISVSHIHIYWSLEASITLIHHHDHTLTMSSTSNQLFKDMKVRYLLPFLCQKSTLDAVLHDNRIFGVRTAILWVLTWWLVQTL